MLCAVIAFLTPVGNLLWFPFPFGVMLMLHLIQGLPDTRTIVTGFTFGCCGIRRSLPYGGAYPFVLEIGFADLGVSGWLL